LLVESLALASSGGLLAWGVTKWGVGAWATTTASRYLAFDYRVDALTAAYLVAISVASSLRCSLVPIGGGGQLGAGHAVTGVGAREGVGGKGLGRGVVGGEMALGVVLVGGGGVPVGGLGKDGGAHTGVRDPGHVVVAGMLVPSDRYRDPAARLAYFDRLEAQ